VTPSKPDAITARSFPNTQSRFFEEGEFAALLWELPAGVRDLVRLCGWETRGMFDRYNIIDEADLAAVSTPI
jgi:hypothetical protein